MDFDDIKQKANELKEDASEKFDRAKDDLSDKADNADDKAHHEAGRLGGEAEEYRREHETGNDYDDRDLNDSPVDDNATTSKNLDHDVF